MQTAEVRRTERGTPQGGVISPLLANCYFRRFLLAGHNHGHRVRLDAHVVNYADDFVICCRPGNAPAAMARMATLMTRLGLEVNAKKTRIARLPEESFDFLGYTVGGFHGKNGRTEPAGNWQPLWTKSFVPAKWAVGPFYDAAVSTAALDVRPDFRFAIWPSPLFFASADRVAAYSGATIG